jgi:hypothetical protein
MVLKLGNHFQLIGCVFMRPGQQKHIKKGYCVEKIPQETRAQQRSGGKLE